MNLKRVLIITYYFPPRPNVASLRLKGLAKYLPEFGWEPVILTATLPNPPDKQFRVIQTHYPGDVSNVLKKKLYLHGDRGFQEQIGVPLAIREGKDPFTNKIMMFIKGIITYPDEQKKWYPFGVKAGHELLQKEKFNAIISSSSPVTTHLIARELKMKYNIPWIADLRDLWTQHSYYSYGVIRKWFERKLEFKTLTRTDFLVTVSNPLAKKLYEIHHNKTIFVISNGFDPDEMISKPLIKKFTITYTGQLSHGKRDPEYLLSALHELILENIINPNDIKVRFFGICQYWLEQMIKKHCLNNIVKQYGVVSREFALKAQRESQILLLLRWNNERTQGVYTGKLFEYLAAKRPILAIGGPKDMLSELLQNTGAGIYINDFAILKKTLCKWYKEYKTIGKVSYYGKDEQIKRYSQYVMAKKFANVLNKACIKKIY